jgi:hypothetical protein
VKWIGFATAIVLVSWLGLGAAARAATLVVSTDKLTYLVGETINVSVIGDSQGGSDNAIAGTLLYSSALTNTPNIPSQSLLISGGLPWIPGVLSFSEGSAEMFDQTHLGAATVSNQLTSTVALVAAATGTVNLNWAGLDFFGLTSASGTSFTINSAPEPATALLMASGLIAIAWGGRHRSA